MINLSVSACRYTLSQQTRKVLATTERELQEIENEIFQLQHSIHATSEIISLNLARSRNRLQTLNLFTSIGAFSMGTGAFGAGIFGMNMPHGDWFGDTAPEGWFYPVTASLTGSCGLMFGICFLLYKKSVNLSDSRSRAGEDVAAFTASLAGHDLSYAFHAHFEMKGAIKKSVGRAQQLDLDSVAIDENPEPLLSKSEFAAIVGSVTGEKPPPEHIDTVFGLIDRNNSGSMNYQEYLAFFGLPSCGLRGN